MLRTATVLLGLALAAGCQEAPPPPPARPLVVATVFPLWEFARQVAGDRAEVVMLVPPGVEPHDWEPTPRDVARVRAARVFVHTGTGFDRGTRLLREIEGSPTLALDATRGLELVRSGPGGESDPHVWLDPVLARAQVELIRAGLAGADPANAGAYEANARAFAERLTALDQAFESGLRDCARRTIVVSHAAFGYLARRYGLTQVGLAGLSPEAEPNPAQLAAAARLARRERVTHIFFEALVSPKLAETLAREIGAKTLVLDPLEGPGREEAGGARDYLALMEQNLRNLRTALGCR